MCQVNARQQSVATMQCSRECHFFLLSVFLSLARSVSFHEHMYIMNLVYQSHKFIKPATKSGDMNTWWRQHYKSSYILTWRKTIAYWLKNKWHLFTFSWNLYTFRRQKCLTAKIGCVCVFSFSLFHLIFFFFCFLFILAM